MLTRTGAGVALAGGLVIVGALTGLPDLTLVGAGCLASLALAVVWVTFTAVDLAVRREVTPLRLREGGGASASLHIENRGRRPSPRRLAVEVYGGTSIPVAIPRIAAGGRARVDYQVPPLSRGSHRVQPLRIGQTDPFQLLRGSQQCGPLDLIVHPRTVPLRPLFTSGPIDADGSVTGSNVTAGEEFRSLRPYETGDDPRAVHWRSSARLGTLAVRVNVVPDQPRYLVLVDTSGPPYGGYGERFEEAVRIAASVCAMAIGAGFPLLLATTADGRSVTVDPARSAAVGQTRALDRLAVAAPGPSDPGLAALEERLAGSRGGVLVVITGRATEKSLTQLSRARRRQLSTVLVLVGSERHPGPRLPRVRMIAPRSAEEFASLWDAVTRS